jgi:hypothetical protein
MPSRGWRFYFGTVRLRATRDRVIRNPPLDIARSLLATLALLLASCARGCSWSGLSVNVFGRVLDNDIVTLLQVLYTSNGLQL